MSASRATTKSLPVDSAANRDGDGAFDERDESVLRATACDVRRTVRRTAIAIANAALEWNEKTERGKKEKVRDDNLRKRKRKL